jgi:uncharacterized protein with HEPN domain
MPPERARLLNDMQNAASTIAEFIVGKELPDFHEDKLLRSGIYYQFVLIGEALSRLRQIDSAIAEQITDAWRIIGFRNQIIHGYARIDDEITWRIIQDKLPVLRRELEELLAS